MKVTPRYGWQRVRGLLNLRSISSSDQARIDRRLGEARGVGGATRGAAAPTVPAGGPKQTQTRAGIDYEDPEVQAEIEHGARMACGCRRCLEAAARAGAKPTTKDLLEEMLASLRRDLEEEPPAMLDEILGDLVNDPDYIARGLELAASEDALRQQEALGLANRLILEDHLVRKEWAEKAGLLTSAEAAGLAKGGPLPSDWDKRTGERAPVVGPRVTAPGGGLLKNQEVFDMLAVRMEGMVVKSAGVVPSAHGMRFVVEMERYAEGVG